MNYSTSKTLLVFLFLVFTNTLSSQIKYATKRTVVGNPSNTWIKFFDKNNCKGNAIVTVYGNIEFKRTLIGTPYRLNDAIRSIQLENTLPGTKIVLYDNSEANTNDDYIEVFVKKKIAKGKIITLEKSFENANLKVVYHKNNGLNGKVSYVSVIPPKRELGYCLYPIKVKYEAKAEKRCRWNIDDRFNSDMDFEYHEVKKIAKSKCDEFGLELEFYSTLNTIECEYNKDKSKVINLIITAHCDCR